MYEIILLFILICILNVILFKNNYLFANKLNLYDKPDSDRKLHKHTVPLNGGIFLFLKYIIDIFF